MFFFFHDQFQEMVDFTCHDWVVVVFDFPCASDYIVANNVSLVRIDSIRG
jgi:hypothetical protein